MMHFISSNKGGRFTPRFIEGSDFKHCKPYVFPAFSNQKFLCELLCIMTDQTSGYFCIITMTGNSMTRTENLFYCTVPPTDIVQLHVDIHHCV